MNQPPPWGPPPSFGNPSHVPTLQSQAQPGPWPAQPQAYPSPSYAPPPAYYGYAQPPAMAYGNVGPQPPAGTGAPASRWVVLGTFVASLLLSGASFGISAAVGNEDPGATISAVLFGVASLSFGAYFIAALVWLYKSWAMLPESARFTGNGTRVTPGGAVGFLFVPFYNLYWYFACSAGFCTALNRQLEAYGSPKRASRGLAITAAVFQVIPYVNLVLAPFFWVAFMMSAESAKREYARLAAQQPRMV
jgi:hypothetical protein